MKLTKTESNLIEALRRYPDPMAAFLTAVQIITDHLEGWTAAADRANLKSFISANGREPKNREELYAWVHQICGMLEDAV